MTTDPPGDSSDAEHGRTAAPSDEEISDAWRAARAALSVAGRAAADAAQWIAKNAASAYRSIDPDVRLNLADLPLLATTMLGSRSMRLEPQQGSEPPIVCVHGLAGHPQNFIGLRVAAFIEGRRRFYSLGYDEREPLERAAALLAEAVAEIARVNDLDGEGCVDLVAHSMGGLVARLALQDDALRARARALVTLGTPHHGTLAARFLATDRAHDLRPGSAVLERLSGQVPWRGPPRLVAFWSRSDVLMLPAETARVEGADNRELAGVSHAGYLTRPRALQAVCEALR